MAMEIAEGDLMPTRRALLVTGGAAAAVILAGGSWALTRAPKAARAPWRQAGDSLGDPRLDALSYAILAPNPHNMQPWLIELAGEDELVIHADPDRLLPETDPPGRQTTIGFGCFLELFHQAVAEQGYRAEITPFPAGADQEALDDRPIARIQMIPDTAAPKDPLFGAILERRSIRDPFDTGRSVSPDDLAALKAVTLPGVMTGTSNDPAMVEKLRRLTADAWAVEWNYQPTRQEAIDVTRIGKAEINAKPWGLMLFGPLMDAMKTAGVLTQKKMEDPDSVAFKETQSFYEKSCATAMAHLWTVTATNTREDQLATGRAWVRMHLEATRRGLAFHPLSQPLEEFPAMAEHYRAAHQLLAPEGCTVQMLARLGYAKSPPPAAREPLTSKLIPVDG